MLSLYVLKPKDIEGDICRLRSDFGVRISIKVSSDITTPGPYVEDGQDEPVLYKVL